MTITALAAAVEAAWDARETVTPRTRGEARDAVEAALDLLDRGEVRVAEKTATGWITHQWLKKAVLLSFRLARTMPTTARPRQKSREAKRRAKAFIPLFYSPAGARATGPGMTAVSRA
jgi:tetrahydrodipicolinate N-succinyltransferase